MNAFLPVRIFAAALLPLMVSSAQTRPAAPSAPLESSAADVAQMQDLLSTLVQFDRSGRAPDRKVGFEVPEKTVNAYLAYILGAKPRPGIRAATVQLLPGNEVSCTVEIDFDSVKGWASLQIPEPLRPILSGKGTLQVRARFETQNGFLTFELKQASGPDKNTIPAKLLADIIQALGAHQPEAYDTSRPIPLPFGLKRIWTAAQLVGGET